MITAGDAVALLEQADPVDPLRIADEHDIAAAHDRVRRMIAGGAPPAVPRRRVRSATLSLAAAVAAALAILLSSLPGVGGDSGLAPLDAVAAVASNQPTTIAPPGRYFHVLERLNGYAPVGQKSNIHVSFEWWVAANGSGRLVYRIGPWAPGPAPAGCGCQKSGSTLVFDREFGPGRFAGVYRHYVELGQPHPVNPTTLPTDPIALKRKLTSTGDLRLSQIAALLADPMDPPPLRSALFRVAAQLPRVTLQSHVVDPAGRTGEAVTSTLGRRTQTGQTEFRVIFDQKTSQILAWQVVSTAHGTTWVESRTFLERGIVSTRHSVP